MRIYSIIYLVCIAAVISSCTKDFKEINTNNNSPSTTRPEYHFTEAITQTAYAYQENAFARRPAALGRYITLVRNNDYETFRWTAVDWNDIYQRAMVIKTMQQEASAAAQPVYVATGNILLAFNIAYLTDLYGDVPFSQALQSVETGNIKPAYDKQQDIYMNLLQMLKDANLQLRANGSGIDAGADALYAGKALQWRKLANSLRLRLLMRCSKVYGNAFAEMQEIVNNTELYPIFSSNTDNAEVIYQGVKKDDSWPGGTKNMIDADFAKTKASKELVDILLQRNDPRLAIWVAPVATTTGSTVDHNQYVGVPHALANPADYNGGETHQSVFSSFFKQDKAAGLKASLMLYSEVCFILAEAAQTGKLTVPSKTAASLYHDGIEASMDYYGVKAQALSSGYYDLPLVKYDGTQKQLIIQKWLSMLFRGAEGWFDFRRTGYPEFVPGPMSFQSKFPVRYGWPTSEPNVNNDSYQAAIAVFGADDINTKMWYLR
ncbi:SusD/RagB family nutrient-binding outer membrane lipoprotein [Pedobacter sp. MC2016-14]|uniref:SusD/RagB family nutrient-binding outer membrane lipoprotein n=1 Tax=Pedobacter sp. MC2016-14 TaxID=2897327 RepID=UPI001E47D72F|nr:SusD/RagB family nutrient-binding outer membrane lipoprotein [Pedobacter sp. MC2016-14]MCD0487935.1 SusD/RagB family nutrient-binding outer membrane lipoprotein [Pedobacter sp. MC2016-14]